MVVKIISSPVQKNVVLVLMEIHAGWNFKGGGGDEKQLIDLQFAIWSGLRNSRGPMTARINPLALPGEEISITEVRKMEGAQLAASHQ